MTLDQLVTYLGPRDVVDERPFTDPSTIEMDLNIMRYLIDQLALILRTPHFSHNGESPLIIHQPHPERWVYRMVIPQPELLLSATGITAVGFLGQRRPEADPGPANEFDKLLIAEIPDHPGILSYSSMALVTGDFCNVVLFASPESKLLWSKSTAHGQAVGKLAPDYYHSVRLYNGDLPHGIRRSHALRLARIKYFDYQTRPLWRAIREFPQGTLHE